MIGTLGWQELLIVLVLPVLPVAVLVAVIGSKPTEGLIETLYEENELKTASSRRRLGGYLLETVLGVLTLGIGWLIWFVIVAPRGQTPAKQLLGMYILRSDGTRAGGWYVWLRELIVKGLLFGLLAAVTFYLVWIIGALWCLWDRDRQCLWDKVASTIVAHSTVGFRPLTAGETVLAGASVRAPAPRRGGATSNVADALRDLKSLVDDGIITRDEYEERRRELVQRL